MRDMRRKRVNDVEIVDMLADAVIFATAMFAIVDYVIITLPAAAMLRVTPRIH